MAIRTPQHERIRFRKEEIADLDRLPSALESEGQQDSARTAGRPRRFGWRRAVVGVAAAIVFMFFALVGGIYVADAAGIGQERLRAAAERAVERLVGRNVATTIGDVRLSLSGARLLEVDVTDVGLVAVGQPQPFAQAASLRFGLELIPLISGRVVLSTAALSDVALSPAGLGLPEQRDWLAWLRDERGLLDPDKLSPALFAGLRRLFDTLHADEARSLDLSNVTIEIPSANGSSRLTIAAASARAEEPEAVTLFAAGTFAGRDWTVEGRSRREAETGRIADLALSLASPAADGGPLGDIGVQLTGSEAANVPLSLSLRIADATFDPDKRGPVSMDIALDASLPAGQKRLAINELRLAFGNSTLALKGAVRPEEGAAPRYVYDLAGEDLVLAAADSPEPPLRFAARVDGFIDPAARRLEASAASVVTASGRADAQGGVTFEPGKSPGIDLSLGVAAMPVAEVKQLWPWLAARGARIWVQQHVSSGTVTRGSLRYSVRPGRIGDGTPPTADEVFGTFDISDAGFDTARGLPPVNAAAGTVAFRGTDADVALSSGAMRLPSGKVVSPANAKFALRNTTRPPIVGRLDLDFDADAGAVAELVALPPINAFARVPFAPSDVSGRIAGHVSADVPLSRGVPRESLEWLTLAELSDFAIAAPFEGQRLSAAKGTLSAEPLGVQLDLDGKLNGTPAKLLIAEPLRDGGPPRRRDVALTVDDKARDALAPGLSAFVDGPTVLKFDAAAEERKVEVDLARSTLSLAAVGWSKGSGVPASATFTLKKQGERTVIPDLAISGESFNVAGSMTFARAGIESARFSRVQLNRDDRVAVDVERDGGGYAVTVRGSSFDGRALVKASTATAARQAGAGSQPFLTVKAKLDAVTGFNGESLRDVDLSFRNRREGRSLEITGATERGAPVALQDETAGGRRKLILRSGDAGSMLRFFNVYPRMQGGAIEADLASRGNGPLTGTVSASDFLLVDEPRLASLVSSKPAGADRSLRDALRKEIDTTRARFSSASADIEKGAGYLRIANGILRGTAIGSAFQGTLYNAQGRMDMTGTFMPAYGLNRLFGELPLLGIILGNGNDRGLLGVTFKLEGSAQSPVVTVNPLSIIAPGIFRRVFEFEN